MASDVKWIKICTDIFDDEKILLIESIPEADAIIVIWFKLLCLAGKQNNRGVFMMNDKIAYTDEMLSTIFRKPINLVRLALQTFEQFRMIELINNVITIPNWEKHQNIEGMEKIKEQNRLRKQKERERKKLVLCDSNVTVTQCHATDKEEDKDLEKEREKNNVDELPAPNNTSKTNEIIDYLNSKAKTSYRAKSKSTQQHINARLKEGFTVEDFKAVIDNMCEKWMGSEFEQYLRPSTLFGSKFENYLNAKGKSQPKEPIKYGGTYL